MFFNPEKRRDEAFLRKMKYVSPKHADEEAVRRRREGNDTQTDDRDEAGESLSAKT